MLAALCSSRQILKRRFYKDFLWCKFLLIKKYVFWTSVALCICPTTAMESDGYFFWSRMIQLVPICIGKSHFIHTYCCNAFRLCGTCEQPVTKSTFFTLSLPLHNLDCCGQPQSSDTQWKWWGRSVPHSAVQADGAVVENTHSARIWSISYILRTNHTGMQHYPCM